MKADTEVGLSGVLWEGGRWICLPHERPLGVRLMEGLSLDSTKCGLVRRLKILLNLALQEVLCCLDLVSASDVSVYIDFFFLFKKPLFTSV